MRLKKKPELLTKSDMDIKECNCPEPEECDHSVLFIHAACHPESPTWVSYFKGSGELLISCGVCLKPLYRVLVADPISRS